MRPKALSPLPEVRCALLLAKWMITVRVAHVRFPLADERRARSTEKIAGISRQVPSMTIEGS